MIKVIVYFFFKCSLQIKFELNFVKERNIVDKEIIQIDKQIDYWFFLSDLCVKLFKCLI